MEEKQDDLKSEAVDEESPAADPAIPAHAADDQVEQEKQPVCRPLSCFHLLWIFLHRIDALFFRYQKLWMTITCASFLFSLLLQVYMGITGKIVRRSPAAPTPFFRANTSVTDLYEGNDVELHRLLNQSTSAFVMYYAPWSADCIAARRAFERLAAVYPGDTRFVAVNCWSPTGQCRRAYRIYTFPVFTYHSAANETVHYLDAPLVDYMYHFLTAIERPLTILHSTSDVERLISSRTDAVVLAFANLNSGWFRLYRRIYSSAVRSFEQDPQHSNLQFGVILDHELAASYGLTPIWPVQLFQLKSPTKPVYYEVRNESTSQTGKTLRKFFGANRDPIVQWLSATEQKTDHLDRILAAGPTILLFTPRQPLIDLDGGHYSMFRELALGYYNCPASQRIDRTIAYLRAKRRATAQTLRDALTTCGDQGCSASLLSHCCNDIGVASAFDRAANVCSVCPPTGEATYSTACQAALYNLPDHDLSLHCCNQQQQPISALSPECRLIRVAKMRQYDLQLTIDAYDDDPVRDNVRSQINGLACQPNKTLHFVVADSVANMDLAIALGIFDPTRDGPPSRFSAVISIDPRAEEKYKLEQPITRLHLEHFILAAHEGTLRQALHLRCEQRLETYRRHDNANEEIKQLTDSSTLNLLRINGNDFLPKVVNSNDTVVLLYHSPTCGACKSVYHTFLTLSLYFRDAPSMIFAQIDAHTNELPWQFTVDRLPSVLVFPSPNSTKPSIAFPSHLPLSLRNLVAFVLSSVDVGTRARFGLSACGAACRERHIFKARTVMHLLRQQTRVIRRRLLAAAELVDAAVSEALVRRNLEAMRANHLRRRSLRRLLVVLEQMDRIALNERADMGKLAVEHTEL